jgi:hypothetical protein
MKHVRRCRSTVIAICAALSLVCVPANHGREIPRPTRAGYKHKLPQPNWDMKYESGSFQLEAGQWLKGAFVPEEAARKSATAVTISVGELPNTGETTPILTVAPVLTIASEQLGAIYFDAKAEKDSDLLQRMSRSGCGYAKSLMPQSDSSPHVGVFMAWARQPGRISRAVEHLNQRRPVRLVWKEGAAEKELVLKVSRCEYASFLANFRRFAGQRWQEVGHELK